MKILKTRLPDNGEEYRVNFREIKSSVPGRSGDLIMPNGRYPNVQVSYSVYVPTNSPQELAETIRQIKAWLYSDIENYYELHDSYDGYFFRYAAFASKLDIDDEAGKIGIFTITFSCKPFKYSYEGQREIIINSSGQVTNPFVFTAKPRYRLYGSGTCSMTLTNGSSGSTWTFIGVNEYVDIDCEQMNFYKGPVLKNNTVSGTGFPDLKPGITQITLGRGSTSVSIIPRWMTL